MIEGAVLDMGTNTFHLVIAKVCENDIQIIERARRVVQLAERSSGVISDLAIARAKAALYEFKKILSSYRPIFFKVVGTSAMRLAGNSHILKDAVYEILNADVEIINGETEAQLIYEGNLAFLDSNTKGSQMIMDIGGGSVEFILFNKHMVQYQESINIGIASLKNALPTNGNRINQISLLDCLDKHTKELRERIQVYQIRHLIGTSGCFDELYSQLKDMGPQFIIKDVLSYIQNAVRSQSILRGMAQSKHTDVIYITLCLSLVEYILGQLPDTSTFRYSPHGLREGVLFREYGKTVSH